MRIETLCMLLLCLISYSQNQEVSQKDFLLGKFDYTTHDQFEKVDSIYASKELYLNKEVYNAFKNMFHDAKKDSIDLTIISGTRNYFQQKAIWEKKWKTYKALSPLKRAYKILEYSSMPSTSRHHWGTDLDLNSLKNSFFTNGQGKLVYEWLTENAHKYGFYQVYTSKKNGRSGYNLENWHWSFMPLAAKYLKAYNKNITIKDINGFKGFKYAKDIDVISKYVNGIYKPLLGYETEPCKP